MTITTTRPTRLNWSSDLSKRTLVPEGTRLDVVTQVYGGKVLKVLFEGSEYYTANPDWTPPEAAESAQQSVPEPAKTLPWDRPQKQGRGRPRKEKTQ